MTQFFQKYLTQLLALATVLSFTCITDNDSKWELPIIMWGLVAILAGAFRDKAIGLLILLSWLYLWLYPLVGPFQKRLLLPTTAVLILVVAVLLDGYQIVTHENALNRNQWLCISGAVFLLLATALLIQIWKKRPKRVNDLSC